MKEGIVVGIIQGIAEWLPISSEGMIALAEIHFFGKTGVEEIIQFALFLHLGTFLAALVYLRKDVWRLIIALPRYNMSATEEKSVLRFFIISTALSGVLGLLLLKTLGTFAKQLELSGRVFTAFIGVLLLVTAWLQLIKKEKKIQRKEGNLNTKDALLLGVAQGIAVLPGLSRSGLTISALLLRNVEDNTALRISFLMSLPIVLMGNIILNLDMFGHIADFSSLFLWGFLFSFTTGLLTIHVLIKLANKVNFGYFVGFFGLFMILAALA